MRKAMTIMIGAALMLALALPAFAWYRILSDEYDRARGGGVAIVQLESGMYAEVRYRDMDMSQGYTHGDVVMSIRYFRRAAEEIGDRGPSFKRAPR